MEGGLGLIGLGTLMLITTSLSLILFRIQLKEKSS